jgi:hypothetical protein
MEKANIRTYFSIIPQTRIGSERLVDKILYALLIYGNNEQAGAKLQRHSYFQHICHLTVDLTALRVLPFSLKESGCSLWKSAQFETVHNSSP